MKLTKKHSKSTFPFTALLEKLFISGDLMTRINRCFYLFTISFLFTFPLEAGARNIFAAKKIFTSDKTIDLIAWKVDGTTIFLDSTIGSAQNIGSFRLSSFLIRPYSPGKNDRDDYLYWAFLNLTSNSKSEDLSTRILEQQTFFDSLPRPLLALKQKGDSCQYLVLYRITYAPLAAGKVACPDLEKGIQEVDKELLGFQLLTAKDSHNPVHIKIIRRGEVSLDIPNAIDFGIESSAALSFGLSSDKDAD